MVARRIGKGLLWGIIGIVVLVGLLAGGGILWLRSSWGHAFVKGQIEERLGGAMNGEIRVGSVEGDPLSGIALNDFALIGPSGEPFVKAERLEASYALRPFLDRKIVIQKVRLVRPDIHLVRGPDHRWNFQTLFKERGPKGPSGPPGWGSLVRIDDLELVDATLQVRFSEGGWPVLDWNENDFQHMSGHASILLDSRRKNRKRFEVHEMSLETTAPALSIRRLEGTAIATPDSVGIRSFAFETPGSTIRAEGLISLAERDSIDLEVDAPRLSLDEANRFFPQIRLQGSGSYRGRIAGPLANPDVGIEEARLDTGRSEIQATGSVGQVASARRLDLDLRVDPLAPADVRLFVGAYPVVQPLTGRVRVEGGPARPRIRADVRSRAGGMTVDGRIDRTDPATGYDLSATGRSLDVGALIGRPEVEVVLTGDFTMAGRGFGASDLDARVTGDLGPSRIYRWDLVSGRVRGRLVGRRFVADTVVARMPRTVIRGAGTFGLASDGVIRADVDASSEDLGELWPSLGDWADRARAEVRLDGTYRGFGVTGEVTGGGLHLAAARADSFAGTVRMTGVASDSFDMAARGTFRDLGVAGIVADTAGVRLDYAAGRMRIDGAFDLRGEAEATLGATADFTGPETSLTFDSLRYATADQTWRLAEGGRLTVLPGRIVADSVRLAEDGQAVRLDGTLGFDRPSDLTFAAEDVSLRDLAELTGRPAGDWAGRATVRGRLEGSREAPTIAVDGEVSKGMIRGFRFQRMSGHVRYEDQVADVNLTVTTPTEGHDLVLRGKVPIDLALAGGVNRLPDRPVDLHVEGQGTDLSLLAAFVPGLRDLAGPVDLRVDVSGSSQAPRFQGRAELRDGRMTIPATGVTYTGIQGIVTFDNDRIQVERIQGADGAGGRFSISGTVAMENLRFGDLDLKGTAEGLTVIDQNRQNVKVRADVQLAGTTDLPVLTGNVVVEEAIYRLPERSNKDVIDLDEAVIYVDIPGAERAAIARSPSLWTRTRLNVNVQVTDNAILQSNNARIEIAGDLSLLKTSGTTTPTFSGTLEVKRGFYEEFGRRFTIEGGEVFFYGTPELNPGLHITATRTVSGVTGVGDVNIRITLGGTARNPTIDLSSSPPYDKSEIISIALFGTPNPSAGQQAEFQRTVGRLVAGTAAGPLESALAEELGLDLLEVSQSTEPTGDVATLFRIGKFLNPDVYLTFEQEVGGTEDRSTVALRYQITDRFTLQASAGTGKRTQQTQALAAGVDLFWEITY